MTKINIKRKSDYINRLRDYRIYINGRNVGKIGNGESKSFEVENGNHAVEVRIDWCGSKKVFIDVENGETKTLNVSSFSLSKWILPTLFCLLLLDFAIKIVFNFRYTFYLSYLIFFVLIYYFTIGRKQYLKVKVTV